MAVDLIGADLEQSQVVGASRFQEGHDADHVRPGKCRRVEQRAIDVRFGGKVDDRVDILRDLPDQIGIGNVALNEAESSIIAHVVQIRWVTRISQQVETEHLVIRLLAEYVSHVGGTDESSGAGDQNTHAHSPPPTLARSFPAKISAASTGTYSFAASRQSRSVMPSAAARRLRRVLSAGRRAG